jgi:hypothetical protein
MLLRVMRAQEARCSSRCADSIRFAVLYASFDQIHCLSSFIDTMIFMCFVESLWYLQKRKADGSTLQTSPSVALVRVLSFGFDEMDEMELIEHSLLAYSATADCPTLFADACVLLDTRGYLVSESEGRTCQCFCTWKDFVSTLDPSDPANACVLPKRSRGRRRSDLVIIWSST